MFSGLFRIVAFQNHLEFFEEFISLLALLTKAWPSVYVIDLGRTICNLITLQLDYIDGSQQVINTWIILE